MSVWTESRPQRFWWMTSLSSHSSGDRRWHHVNRLKRIFFSPNLNHIGRFGWLELLTVEPYSIFPFFNSISRNSTRRLQLNARCMYWFFRSFHPICKTSEKCPLNEMQNKICPADFFALRKLVDQHANLPFHFIFHSQMIECEPFSRLMVLFRVFTFRLFDFIYWLHPFMFKVITICKGSFDLYF